MVTGLFEGSASQLNNLALYLCFFEAIYSGAVAEGFEVDSKWIRLGIPTFFILVAINAFISVRFKVYRVTNERIEVEKGLISKRIDHIDLFQVKDTKLKVGIIDRLFGIGDVIIISEDSTDSELTVQDIRWPRALYDQLKKEAVRADRRRGILHLD